MPGSSLRAPLLWLLVPFMAGIALADARHAAPHWIPLFALVAAGLGLLSKWCAHGDTFLARAGWAATLIGSGLLAGFMALHLRSPRLDGPEAAPREVVVVIEAEQIFPPSSARKTLSGLGRIVSADRHLLHLTGQRVYFSAIKRLSLIPERSGRYEIRGVLQTRQVAGASNATAGFQRYLESAGIHLTLMRAQLIREIRPPGWFRRFCSHAEDRLEAILRQGIEHHPAETSLYLGMLLGEKAALSADQQNAFMRSGTFHIFSISGLHVGVIAAAILAVLQLFRLSRRTATLSGLLILWLYVQITGASVPAERALLMIAFLSGSRLFRLPANSLAALAASALLTLSLDPQQLFSTGFQMSYAVVTALVVMSAPMAERWQAAWRPWRDLPEANWGHAHHSTVWVGREIIAAWSATWVALLASAPSSIGYFGLFSPGALLANLLIIPLSSLAIIAGFASLVGGLCGLTGISLLFNHSAILIIRIMDWLVAYGTDLPGVYFRAQFLAAWIAPSALIFLLAVMFTGASLRWPRRWGTTWWPALAVALIMFFGVKFG